MSEGGERIASITLVRAKHEFVREPEGAPPYFCHRTKGASIGSTASGCAAITRGV